MITQYDMATGQPIQLPGQDESRDAPPTPDARITPAVVLQPREAQPVQPGLPPDLLAVDAGSFVNTQSRR